MDLPLYLSQLSLFNETIIINSLKLEANFFLEINLDVSESLNEFRIKDNEVDSNLNPLQISA